MFWGLRPLAMAPLITSPGAETPKLPFIMRDFSERQYWRESALFLILHDCKQSLGDISVFELIAKALRNGGNRFLTGQQSVG